MQSEVCYVQGQRRAPALPPGNGMQVIASGRISVYPRDGAYQLYCTGLTPEGAGDLSVAFEQLKEKLRKEGLFDETHKNLCLHIPGASPSSPPRQARRSTT